jgi:hypothetical protein
VLSHSLRETEETIDQWKGDLDALLASSDSEDPVALTTRLSQLAARLSPADVEALLGRYPNIFAYSPKLASADYERTLRRDSREAERILNTDLPVPTGFRDVADQASKVLYDRVADMFEHIDFAHCPRVVMIGCGRVPATVFHIHDRTDVPDVVGLDVVPESVEIAGALARKLGYPRARFELADGRAYDFAEAPVVFVGRMVSPKRAVLSHIADTAPANIQIIMRDPISVGLLWSECGEQDLDPRLEIISRGRPGGFGALGSNLTLRKRSRPA